jgi:hypothetical protein
MLTALISVIGLLAVGVIVGACVNVLLQLEEIDDAY